MHVLKISRHNLFVLLAAAGLCLLAASGVSCGDRSGDGSVSDAAPSADTLALVEGLGLFEDGKYDLAREQLSVSSRSPSTYIRAESFLYLNALETELGNYDAARPWLERYHAEAVRLLQHAADANRRMGEEVARLGRRHDALIAGVICAVVLIAGALLLLVRRWRRPETGAGPVLESGFEPGFESEPPQPGISEWKHYLVDAEIFKRTAIYAEIARLAAQKPGRDARVLPSARHDELDRELAERFGDFAARLRGGYPALTAGDVKLCCLSLLPLSPFARALCFGSTETNIIKQRKHTIKKKMAADGHARALFEFIFEARI